MAFALDLPLTNGNVLPLSVDIGSSLFVLGANGTGKSSLMYKFYSSHRGNAHRILAHRQIWFESNIARKPDVTFKQVMIADDALPESRWQDGFGSQRASIAINDLVDSENLRAREIMKAVDTGMIESAQTLSKKASPINIINKILKLSNIPIELAITADNQIVARKNHGESYSITRLSDGERSALLVATTVLTVKPGTLLIIDEPERHLYRSIISPLLTSLFLERPDCAFVISTHEVMLPLDNKTSQTLLLHSCTDPDSSRLSWEADLIPAGTEIDEELKKDILGNREKILFIEGNAQSLDKPLYSLLFPNVSIVPKASCRDVEHAVTAIRSTNALHWLKAWGIIDNDGRTRADIEHLKNKGVYALPFYSVESIYYHPEILRRVLERHAAVTGEDAYTLFTLAEKSALASIEPHRERLVGKLIEKRIREEVFNQLPNNKDIATGKLITLSIEIDPFFTEENNTFKQAILDKNLLLLVTRYPIRETPALNKLAEKVGFRGPSQYENAVRKLLLDDADALSFVKSLFDPLIAQI